MPLQHHSIEEWSTTLADIRDSIEAKSGKMTSKSLENYKPSIDSIPVNPVNYKSWQTDPLWPSLDEILEQDDNDWPLSPARIVCLLTNSQASFTLPNPSVQSVVGFKTSDGAKVEVSTTSAYTHTWDISKDIPYNEHYKLRWVIVYFRAGNQLLNSANSSSLPFSECLKIELADIYINALILSHMKLCQEIIIKGLTTFVGTSLASSFAAMTSLVRFTGDLPTPNCTTFANLFLSDVNLLSTGSFNFSKASTANAIFSGCNKLQTTIDINAPLCTVANSMFYNTYNAYQFGSIYLPLVTNASSMFSGTSNMTDINLTIGKITNATSMWVSITAETIPYVDYSSCTNFSSAFSNFRGRWLPEIDATSAITTTNMFYLCDTLIDVKLKNIGVSFSLSSSTQLTHDCLMYIINNAKTVTGQTMTLGAINLAKLSSQEKLIATNKGWNLA